MYNSATMGQRKETTSTSDGLSSMFVVFFVRPTFELFFYIGARANLVKFQFRYAQAKFTPVIRVLYCFKDNITTTGNACHKKTTMYETICLLSLQHFTYWQACHKRATMCSYVLSCDYRCASLFCSTYSSPFFCKVTQSQNLYCYFNVERECCRPLTANEWQR